jgi:transcriptional regulator with XRE-family HTH domain
MRSHVVSFIKQQKMDKNIQIAESIKNKRNNLGWSKETLAYKSKVSSSIITKLEKGSPVREENRVKVLMALGMKDTLHSIRNDEKVGFKALSLEELRTCSLICKDFMRDSLDPEIKRETMSYKNATENEILIRLRALFNGEFI